MRLYGTFASAALVVCALLSCQKEVEAGSTQDKNTGTGIQFHNLSEKQVYCRTPRSEESPAEALQCRTSWGEVYDKKLDVLWLDGDRIMLYGESAQDGAVYATSLDEAADEAVFAAEETVVNDQTRYAIYPASMAGAMHDGRIPVDLSVFASQAYHSSLSYYGDLQYYGGSGQNLQDNSIVPHLPLFASSDSEDFQFQNLCGAINLKLNDYQGRGIRVASVKITADKYISGTMLVNPSDGTLTLSGTSDAQKSITVKSSVSGTPISGSSPGFGASYNWFFFLPVGTYDGFTFAITDTEGNVYTRTTDKQVTLTPGKVRSYPVAQLTIYYGRANCIIADPASTVDIDITPYYTFDDGFSYSSGQPVQSSSFPALTAEVVWEQTCKEGNNTNSITEGSHGFVIEGAPVVIGSNTLRVQTAPGSASGNALVAIKKGDKVLWTYHIWVKNINDSSANSALSDLPISVGGSTYYMLDRNLGAAYGAVTDAANAYMTYGLLYQWGRKDPLPITALPAYSQGATVLFNSGERRAACVQDMLDNPLERIQESGSNRSTLPQNAANLRLWGAPAGYGTTSASVLTSQTEGFAKSVYDPCPEGYMVPQAYYYSGLSIARTARYGFGAWLGYDEVNSAYFALPGYVASTVESVEAGSTKTTRAGSYGWLWCSNPYGSGGWAGYQYRVSFDSSVSTVFSYGGTSACMSVRCMKIPGSETPDQGGGQQESTGTVRVGIMGDSISTFKEWIPSNFAAYYPHTNSSNGKSLTEVEQTWWYRLIYDLMPDATLDRNLSYSGSFVTKLDDGNTRDEWTFPTRCSMYEDPDIIIIHGGTNDRGISRGSMVPLGSFDYSTPTDDLDIRAFRSAYIKTIEQLQANYPGVQIVCLINSVLYVENTEDESKNYKLLGDSIQEIADHYGLPVVSLKGVGYGTLDGLHPDPDGSLVIANKVFQLLSQEGLLDYRRSRD